MQPDADLEKARDLVTFLNACPTPFHAVAEAAGRLRRAGFVRLWEAEEWQVESGARGYLERDGTLIAFVAGHDAPAQAGFTVLGAHTDSPNLRLKPCAEFASNAFQQLAIEVYGGVLLSTWLDRDLAIAGRLITRAGETVLVQSKRPSCRIPNLAIHLNRDVNTIGLVLNPQTQLSPVYGFERGDDARDMLEQLCEELAAQGQKRAANEIAAFDLSLYDTQAGNFGGPNDEFIFSARLDNLASCHACLEAIIQAGSAGASTRVIALYDHEEVGSQSASGARSFLLQSVLERLAFAKQASRQAFATACARSLFVSVDMAHATHPNYADKHDKNHAVRLGAGAVIKSNVNQSYASDAVTSALFRSACEQSGFAPQFFVSRNDMPCGSTIGPISAARLGIRSVDIGNPMLSMHSCREMCAAADVAPMIRVLTRILTDERQIAKAAAL